MKADLNNVFFIHKRPNGNHRNTLIDNCFYDENGEEYEIEWVMPDEIDYSEEIIL